MGIIRKLKEIEPLKLNKIRCIFLILSIFVLVVLSFLVEFYKIYGVGYDIFSIILIVLVLMLTFLMIYKSKTISKPIVLFLFTLTILAGLLFLTFEYLINLSNYDLYWVINDVTSASFIASIILLYIIHFRDIDKFIPWIILLILAGLMLNRIGVDEAFIVIFLGLSFIVVSFIFVSLRSIKYFEDNRIAGRTFFFLGLILAFCNTTFLIRFLQWEAAHISPLDIVGAIFFLIGCLLIFASMPFTNFIEWSSEQKRLFFRAFLIPMVFLFLLFTLKLLLPGNVYQKMFFEGYKEKEKVFFNMDDYEIIDEKGINDKDD